MNQESSSTSLEIAHLERKIFQAMSNTSFGLKPAASFDEKSNGRGCLVAVHRSNFNTRTFNNGGKVTRYALYRAGRSPGCEHEEIMEELG
jgi:hypothetical protein